MAKERGARYEKAKLPFVPYAVVDGNLVTGQNPASAKKTAKEVAALLAQDALRAALRRSRTLPEWTKAPVIDRGLVTRARGGS